MTPPVDSLAGASGYIVEEVAAVDVRPLRAAVLRPGLSPAESEYPGDDEAIHVAATQGGRVLAVATLLDEPAPAVGGIPTRARQVGSAVRLRGMAVAPEHRGVGLGEAVLRHCLTAARGSGAGYLWCNARVAALGFYEHCGLQRVGQEFEVEHIGAHYVMWCSL